MRLVTVLWLLTVWISFDVNSSAWSQFSNDSEVTFSQCTWHLSESNSARKHTWAGTCF